MSVPNCMHCGMYLLSISSVVFSQERITHGSNFAKTTVFCSLSARSQNRSESTHWEACSIEMPQQLHVCVIYIVD